jgi:hypothetical protein
MRPTSPTNQISVPDSSPTSVGRRPCSRIGSFSPAMISARRASRMAAADSPSPGQRCSCHHSDSGRTLRSICSNVNRAATCELL